MKKTYSVGWFSTILFAALVGKSGRVLAIEEITRVPVSTGYDSFAHDSSKDIKVSSSI